MKICFISILEWTLQASKTECSGSEISKGKLPSVDECASECKGISSMFAFGTNDYLKNRCDNNGCNCLCETSAAEEGTCDRVDHNGYRLYKYSKGHYHVRRR